jgi:septum formation topological specificity factor MinE
MKRSSDEILGLLGQLEELHLRKHAGCQIIKEHPNMNKEKFDNLLSTYSTLLNELAPWRLQVIQAGEEATQVQSAQMRKSRKDIMNAAKRRLDEGREKQQLATDASELMKHYKALIMAA